MNEIILIGTGGHARSCIDVIELTGRYKIVGLIERDEQNGEESFNYPLLGTDNDLASLRKKFNHALVAVGQIKSPTSRKRLFKHLKELDYQLPFILSPRAYVSNKAIIGDGTIVLHDAIVNANAKVGQNCIINNKVLIEHDVIVGDHCHISTGAILNGGVVVGSGSFIGSGVVTKQSVSIGNNCIVGAGVILKNNIKSYEVIAN